MKSWNLPISRLFVNFFALSYLLLFFGTFFFVVFAAIPYFLEIAKNQVAPLVWSIAVGGSVALLASLVTWPFALSAATLLEHNRTRKISLYLFYLLRFFASLPLVLFVFIYLEVLGEQGFSNLEIFWRDLFASPNVFTQSLAFALTLLIYPLTILPGVAKAPSVEVFFQDCLSAVLEFAEVGLMTSVLVFGLFFYIFPKMVLHMTKLIKSRENQSRLEVIQSVGGTAWESIHLTVMQSMKRNFYLIILLFTRICFFEGLITFSLIHYFLNEQNLHFFWGETLSSSFVFQSMAGDANHSELLIISGCLATIYIFFFFIERWLYEREVALG